MKKNILIIIGILAASVGAYFLIKGKNPLPQLFKKPDALPPAPDVANANGTGGIRAKTNNTPAPDAKGFPLRRGSNNSYVKAMQLGLNSNYGANLVADGIWGAKTDKALKIAGFGDLVFYKQFLEITKSKAAASSTSKSYFSALW